MSYHLQVLHEVAALLAEKRRDGIADLARMLRPHSPNPDVSKVLDELMATPVRRVPR